MILGNVLLSCIATGVQLLASYERGKDEVLDAFAVIDGSFRQSLGVALWKFNFQQAEVLVDGIYAKSDILYLSLNAVTGQTWQRGDPSASADIERTIPLTFKTGIGDQKAVGNLNVGLTYRSLRDRLWDQLATLVISNFVKTLVASMLMLFIFDRLVARHLRHMSGSLKSDFMLQDHPLVQLKRVVPDQPDELEQIVNALNAAKYQVAKAQSELARINADLRDANREQSEFTYAISHDLKSPMNTLQMLLDELQRTEEKTLSIDGHELLGDAHRTSTRMRCLIDDVLAYARTIGTDPDFEPVNLTEVMDDVLRDLDADIAQSNANISVSDLPTLKVSAVQMRMLFQNLVSNAIKFTKPGQAPQISINATTSPGSKNIEITVADRGIGIAKEYQDQIFGMFQKLHSEKYYPGSGLGLTLCNRIVSNHSGTLNVYSSPDNGTAFTIVLPRGEE